VTHAMLDREPLVNTVSWMVPISQALIKGGIQAAYTRYAEIKASEEYFFDADELVNLAYQLMCAKKFALTIEVLKLNLHTFPDHIESYTCLANLYLQKGERAQAKDILKKALSIQPDSSTVAELLERVCRR
jgi:Tfp pilus assembly protein PilF